MDAYLALAEDVLRRIRRPLSPMQILRAAYQLGIAPSHLKGRTQQKTLGARLSEDILRLRDASRFYRTAPGRFLLSELANDPTIPAELRRPIVARRRRRDLAQKRSLAFSTQALAPQANDGGVVDTSIVMNLIRRGSFHYASSGRQRPNNDIVVWAFAMVRRGDRILSYRQGHYRENRDTFMHKRTVGFYTPVVDEDLSLFDRNDHGIVYSGMKAVATDLDLHDRHLWAELTTHSTLQTFLRPEGGEGRDLLAIVLFTCPEWLDPMSKRLAINNLEWLDLSSPPNHREDFDPWSQAILYDARQEVIGAG